MGAPRKYPEELRERAVRLAVEARRNPNTRAGALRRIGEQLGINPETLRNWVQQAEIDAGDRPGVTTDDAQRIAELEREVRELRRANVILKSASGFLRGGARPPVQQVTRFIDQHKHEFGVEPICRTLQVAPSSYYAAKNRRPSARSISDAARRIEVERVHRSNYGVYGARKVHAQLRREGHVIARCTVERLMRSTGLHGVSKRKGPKTTIPGPVGDRPADLVQRAFTATGPDQLWVADITYIRTFSGWVYAAFVTDVFLRRIVGWQLSKNMRTDLVLDALEMGIWTRQREGRDLSRLIHHSDRGVQYRAIRYTDRLAEAGAVASVGSKGDSYDNALAEAVNSIFKAELIRNKGPWRGIEDLEIATVEYIDWFNHRRLHGELGMIPPVEFEHAHYRHNPAPTTVEEALPSLH
ncbi:IS3 family transposase [Curtobacterium sp. MCSS17_015]|uniref:IS3 family transposase n=1 Tax=Curtobacterium sp. MCSS17_015 TaxID=2175666 RepID=UPI0021ACEA8F|nr:IS3 family transposase [Curtobacterium sp. MCSS17_015]WIB26487.1 IS3 family transposase [Curtobacterium sp. MCSS17_015]